MRKTLVGAVLGTGLVIAGGIGVANAEPPESNAERGNGLSICTFSGQNDEPDDPIEGGRVQSYGQIVKHVGNDVLKEAGEFPGALCNPNNFPLEPWWRETPRKGGGKG